MDSWLRFSAQSQARERLFRATQYACTLLGYTLQKGGAADELRKIVSQLEAHMSLTRKLLRLGNSVEALEAAKRAIHLSDSVLRLCLTISHLNRAMYFACDNVLWAGKTGLISKLDQHKWSQRSFRYYLFALILNLTRDVYELRLLMESEARYRAAKSPPSPYPSTTLPIDPLSSSSSSATTALPAMSMWLHRQFNLIVTVLYETLKGEWNKKNPNLSKCGDLLIKLKVSLLELNFLPTSGSALTKQQLILARDVLEIGALWSILKKDIPSFERYMAQLKCYYFDYKDELPEAAYMHQLLGLNLLFLLSQNRVSEFHTELERLSARDIQTNIYIRHPVSLEQYLMEGNYNKVFLAKGNIPAESYTFFIDILLDTIRDEIAGCIEKAYEQIQFAEATRVLFFSTPKKMTDYAKKRGWSLSPDGYYSFTSQQQRTEEVTIPSTELAQQVIEYARQLEMIV